MNRPGAGPQTLRNVPGAVYTQPTPASRTTSLGSGRLQNGKLASTGAGWGFLGSGAPSVPSRTTSGSFAQTIGGSQPHTPLDLSMHSSGRGRGRGRGPPAALFLPYGPYGSQSAAASPPASPPKLTVDIDNDSEFPSLSGAPQAQQANASSQAIWSSTGLRGPQNSTTRSSNTPASTSQVIRPPSGLSAQPRQPEPQDDAGLGPFPSLGAAADDYPFGQSPASMMARQHQQQQGATDEFPPLGGLGGAGVGQQRSRLGQEPMTNTDALGSDQMHARLPQEAPSQRINDRKDSPPSQGSRVTPGPRSALNLDSERDGLNGLDSTLPQANQLPFRQASNGEGRFSQPSQHQIAIPPGFSTNGHPEAQALPGMQMSESDRFGLKGLQARLDGAFGADQAALATGMDLNLLGLDLNRPEPLSTDWAGPFADPNGRPVIPDFTLPAAYTVQNVAPIHDKIGSFSDETLFMIFYQNPRDELQEMAAAELYGRDWRWHKKLQQWMMKAKEYGEPVLSPSRQEERGMYYFWNVNEWQRDRREFILSYDQLYHNGPGINGMATL